MRKLALCTVLLIAVPNIALAAWWNPFSWGIFKRSPAPETSTEMINKGMPASPADQASEIEALRKEIQTLKSQLTESAPSVKPVVTTQPKAGLTILSVKADAYPTASRFIWETSEPTDSRVFIYENNHLIKTLQSESGRSTKHSTDLEMLLSDSADYKYEVEAVTEEGGVVKKSGTFEIQYLITIEEGSANRFTITNNGHEPVLVNHLYFEREDTGKLYDLPNLGASDIRLSFPDRLTGERENLLRPKESVDIYLPRLGSTWTHLRYEAGSITDEKTGKDIRFSDKEF